MKYFRKYAFNSESSANEKINALGIDEDGNQTHNHAIVRLGNLVVTPAEIDEEGNVITEAVLTDTYHVDVLWDGEPNPDWDAQMVWCAPMGVHTFGSSSAIAEWTEKCKELRPDFFPEPVEEGI